MSAPKRGTPDRPDVDSQPSDPESHIRVTVKTDADDNERTERPDLRALADAIDNGMLSPAELVEQLIAKQMAKARALWSEAECADFEASVRATIEANPAVRQLLGLPPIPPPVS